MLDKLKNYEKYLLGVVIVVVIFVLSFAIYQIRVNNRLVMALSNIEEGIVDLSNPLSENINNLDIANSKALSLVGNVDSLLNTVDISLSSYEDAIGNINRNRDSIISITDDISSGLSKIDDNITKLGSISQSTSDINENINLLSSSLKDTEISASSISENAKEIEEKVNTFSSWLIDAENTASSISEASLALEDSVGTLHSKALDISSNLKEAEERSNALAEATDSYFNELNIKVNALSESSGQIEAKANELTSYLDSLMALRSVDEMLSIINSQQWPDETKDAMFSRILAQEPTNREAFDMYLDFLSETGAGEVYYYDLHSLLSSSLYSVDIEEIPQLLEEINIVNSHLNSVASSNDVILSSSWADLYNAFLDQANSFDRETFEALYASLEDYYSLLSSTTVEIDEQFENAQYVYSYYRSYREYVNLANNLLKLGYSTVDYLYSTANNIAQTLLVQFMSRDSENNGFESLFSSMQAEIESKANEFNLYYENLLASEFQRELSMAENRILPNSLNLSLYNVNGELQNLYSKLASIAMQQSSLDLIDRYSTYVGNYQRALLVKYQEWAGKVLSASEDAIAAARAEDDLTALFDSGYFNIDESLLVPQLKTWYNSLCTDQIINRSRTPLEELVARAYIMGLSDMEKL